MFIKLLNKYSQFLIVWSFIIGCATVLIAQTYTGSPVTKVRLTRAIQSREYAVPFIVKLIREQGVNFEVTSSVEQELVAIKANRQIIDAAKDNFRSPVVSTPVKTNTNATNKNVVITTTPQPEDTTEKYEALYYQGVQIANQLRAATNQEQFQSLIQSMKDIGFQAIKLNPARSEAYKVVGSAFLLTGQFDEAEKYAQEAINRGGSVGFPVIHMYGTPHPEVLHIGRGYITIESNNEFFQFNTGEVFNPQPRGNYNLSGRTVAIFSVSTLKNGTPNDWYFTPTSTGGSGGEAYLIMRLVQKNAMR